MKIFNFLRKSKTLTFSRKELEAKRDQILKDNPDIKLTFLVDQPTGNIVLHRVYRTKAVIEMAPYNVERVTTSIASRNAAMFIDDLNRMNSNSFVSLIDSNYDQVYVRIKDIRMIENK